MLSEFHRTPLIRIECSVSPDAPGAGCTGEEHQKCPRYTHGLGSAHTVELELWVVISRIHPGPLQEELVLLQLSPLYSLCVSFVDSVEPHTEELTARKHSSKISSWEWKPKSVVSCASWGMVCKFRPGHSSRRNSLPITSPPDSRPGQIAPLPCPLPSFV